ncbi:protein disulfide-isomerase A2 [Dryobates pubescens]|uniref:protein disulfide-isomerase A2 n=1 Tax=Dryobates pubescens TaxID=118200 RepID=UPI0023B8FE7E|nr:protein disulfide-isomerase A2 [Dryobates pubescens]
MRGCRARVVWLLVLSLAWLCPALGDEEKDGEVVAEEEEVLSDELEEEENVLVLHEHNFARALSEHRLLLVEFYAPWCGHCQRLAPSFAQAATTLRNESSPVRLGKVDATAQTALATEFGVTSYPTLKLFRDGNRTHPVAYTGRMDAEGIVRWMQRRAGPSATLLQDTDTAAAFISSQDLVVVGFFKDLGGEAAQAFLEVASEVVDMPFGVAEQDQLFQVYGLSADTVCLFKKFDEGRTDFPVDPTRGLDTAELTQLLRIHSMKLVMEFSSETSSQIFGVKIPHHMILFLNKSSSDQLALQDSFRAAAGAFRGKVLFVVVDVTGYGAEVLPFFGMTPADAPTLRLVKMENNRKYQMEQDSFSDTAIRSFIQAVLDGRVKPHLLSAEPPEDWDKRPVKVLVGKTFEQVAFDETKNVFVKFYAPWCSHCQAMAAAWEELGERYKDHEDIVIAELDSTANELENITISGFPTLHYFPAGPGRKMVEYKNARDVETFSKFLENGGTLPEEPPVLSKSPENSTGESATLRMDESRDEL